MKKLANNIKWMLAITGTLMIIMGVLLLAHPFTTTWSLAGVAGWLLLAVAIIDVVAFIVDFNKFYAGWLLLRGLVTGTIGVMLAFRPDLSVELLMMLFGIWVVVSGGIQFANSFIARALFQKDWYWPALGGIIEVIAGIIIVIHPGFAFTIAAYVIGISMIIDGIVNYIDAFKIQKGLSEIKHWEKAIKKLFAPVSEL